MLLQLVYEHRSTIIPGIAALVLAFVLPIGILITRDNVKFRRQEIIKELENFFEDKSAPPNHPKTSVIPSFEFVKTKYYIRNGELESGEIPIRWYSVPIFIFACLSAVGFTIASVLAASMLSSSPISLLNLIPKSLLLIGGSSLNSVQEENIYFLSVLTVASFAFIGAYVSAIKSFIRSVANFDLSPLTFFRASYGIVAAMVITVVIWRSIPPSLIKAIDAAVTSANDTSSHGTPLWFAAAFLIGFVPTLAERYILSLWRRGNVKRLDQRATDRTKTIPLELIDGIDADIRARLEDFNLFDVQNLATANPIMLFVETPYGIYQSIDWVAQAQLATAVGVDKYLKLRQLSLRTIFDLERALLSEATCVSPALPTCVSPELSARVADILLPDRGPGPQPQSLGERLREARALGCMIIDDLAVLRLRQIWNTVEQNLQQFAHLKSCPVCTPSGRVAPALPALA